jgi:hypothetical protein
MRIEGVGYNRILIASKRAAGSSIDLEDIQLLNLDDEETK